MLKLDTRAFQKMTEHMRKNLSRIEVGKTRYFNKLINKMRIRQKLEMHMDNLVYGHTAESVYLGRNKGLNQSERAWYKRTGDLKKSIRLDRGSNNIFLYTSKDYLESRVQANVRSIETGYDEQAHNRLKNYAWTVEKGHYYENIDKSGTVRFKGCYMPPRPFMESTFNDIRANMTNSAYHPARILDELVRRWN